MIENANMIVIIYTKTRPVESIQLPALSKVSPFNKKYVAVNKSKNKTENKSSFFDSLIAFQKNYFPD